MKPLPTQIGISATADFEENTWTFEMQDGFEVKAGEYVIMPKEIHDRLVSNLRGLFSTPEEFRQMELSLMQQLSGRKPEFQNQNLIKKPDVADI